MKPRMWMVRIPGGPGNTCTDEVDLWFNTSVLTGTDNNAVQVLVQDGDDQEVQFYGGPLRLPVEMRRLRPEHSSAVDELLLHVRFHVNHHGDRALIEGCGQSMCVSAYEAFLETTGGPQQAVSGQGSK